MKKTVRNEKWYAINLDGFHSSKNKIKKNFVRNRKNIFKRIQKKRGRKKKNCDKSTFTNYLNYKSKRFIFFFSFFFVFNFLFCVWADGQQKQLVIILINWKNIYSWFSWKEKITIHQNDTFISDTTVVIDIFSSFVCHLNRSWSSGITILDVSIESILSLSLYTFEAKSIHNKNKCLREPLLQLRTKKITAHSTMHRINRFVNSN